MVPPISTGWPAGTQVCARGSGVAYLHTCVAYMHTCVAYMHTCVAYMHTCVAYLHACVCMRFRGSLYACTCCPVFSSVQCSAVFSSVQCSAVFSSVQCSAVLTSAAACSRPHELRLIMLHVAQQTSACHGLQTSTCHNVQACRLDCLGDIKCLSHSLFFVTAALTLLRFGRLDCRSHAWCMVHVQA